MLMESYGVNIQIKTFHKASVFQRLDSAIYPVDNTIDFPNTYPLDCDLSGG